MQKNKVKIGVIGLGYVGLPICNVFSKKYRVFGYDKNKERIKKFRPLVILIDISGSMENYSRIMLFLSHILIQQHKDIEVFTFGTKLTRITKFLKNKDSKYSKIKIEYLLSFINKKLLKK